MEEKTAIEKSFKFALIGVTLIILATIAGIININIDSYGFSMLIGLAFLTAGVIGTSGFVYCMNGLKEKKSLKMLFSLIVNLSLMLLLITLIIAMFYFNLS